MKKLKFLTVLAIILCLVSVATAATTTHQLSKTKYTKINVTLGPITIEARSERVFLIFSETEPLRTSVDAHKLEANDVIRFGVPIGDLWALGTAQNQEVIVTEGADVVERAEGGPLGLITYSEDSTSPPFSIYLSKTTDQTTTATPMVIGAYTVDVTDATGFAVADYVFISDIAANRFYVCNPVSFIGVTLTCDSQFDYAYPAGVVITAGSKEMNVNGAITPQIFSLRAADPGLPLVADITRLIFECEAAVPVELDNFCGVPELTRGLQLRRIDGITQNIENFKNMSDVAGAMYDLRPSQSINPAQGVDGFVSRWTFAGKNKMGVALRAGPDEDFQGIVADDWSTIPKFRIKVQGHIVE